MFDHISLVFALEISLAIGLMSNPCADIPAFIASTSVVPEPQKGSSND